MRLLIAGFLVQVQAREHLFAQVRAPGALPGDLVRGDLVATSVATTLPAFRRSVAGRGSTRRHPAPVEHSLSRRGAGEGGIYRRADGRWTASVELPRRGGKRRRKVLYARRRAELLAKVRDAARPSATQASRSLRTSTPLSFRSCNGTPRTPSRRPPLSRPGRGRRRCWTADPAPQRVGIDASSVLP